MDGVSLLWPHGGWRLGDWVIHLEVEELWSIGRPQSGKG